MLLRILIALDHWCGKLLFGKAVMVMRKAPLCKGCARRRVQSATAQRAALSAELGCQKSLIFDWGIAFFDNPSGQNHRF